MRSNFSNAAFLVLLIGIIGCGSSDRRKTSSTPPVGSEPQQHRSQRLIRRQSGITLKARLSRLTVSKNVSS